jgi:hypothetical protein
VAFFKRRQGIIFAGERIFDPKVVVKGMWPKSWFQARTSEHGTKGVANGLVCALDRTILMGTVGTGGLDLMTKLGKESPDLGVLIQFTTLVKVDILFGMPGELQSSQLCNQLSGAPFEIWGAPSRMPLE